MKVLWIGDAVIQSGFSILTHSICNELAEKTDLVVYGVRYDGRLRHPFNYHIYPAQMLGDLYSYKFAAEVVLRENPDIVVLFNDLWIVGQYLQAIRKYTQGYTLSARYIPLFPVNCLPIDKDDLLNLTLADVHTAMAYTEFAKKRVKELNPNLNVTPIYHGVDHNRFYPIPEVKQEFGYKNYFVVGNVSTNTYRKRLDLFLEGFAKFAKGKEDVRCLIHANNKDISYSLADIASDFGITEKVIFSSNELEFDKMNAIYNLMDVNVNTSLGEGFGLPLLEGAACSIPIICPPHGNLKDIWGDNADYIATERSEYIAGSNLKGDVISVNDLADKLGRFYEDRIYLAERKQQVLEASKDSKFNWSTVANKVFKVLSDENKARYSFVS